MKFTSAFSRFLFTITLFVTIFYQFSYSQSTARINLDTIKAGRFDTGKMWTFENPPTKYFEEEYGFTPDKDWFNHVQLATLKFADYCSASFVSEDGLIMTNHHCARESVTEIISEGEDFHKDGFVAWELSEERPIPGLFVEQCIGIEDVTEEIQSALEMAKSDSERIAIESQKIIEIEGRYEQNEKTFAKVTPLYFGGKYSLYIYKRYNDVRLVFAPESQAGYFGGDYDNFTYPRYNLDCSFFRVYDEGVPLKVEHYFNWSDNGAEPGDVVFVPGNPGATTRLSTIAQLEYARDYNYPQTIQLVESFIEFLEGIIEDDPESADYLTNQLLNYYNSRKAYKGMLNGLRDPLLMQRKRVFENELKAKVQSNPDLNEKYGTIWKEIENLMTEFRKLNDERNALSYNSVDAPEYFFIAGQVLEIAEELKLPEPDRSEMYNVDNLDNTIESILPESFDSEMNIQLLKNKIDELCLILDEDDEILKKFTNGKTGDEAVEDILSRSYLTSSKKIRQLINSGHESIINSDDPFIQFIQMADRRSEIISERESEIAADEQICNQKLGRVLFEVYGTSIPPDATFTLRISDGVVKGFDYNGTIAPPITTFYGLLDRYYSFNGKFPWNLHERWLDAPEEFDFSTPFNFVTTNDVVGGNSGSPIINKDAEIVGVSFDGNIQSLPGDFIYDPEVNRSVGVHSAGMLEAIKDLYKFERLANELINGKRED
jgi:hypothetical protein